MVIKAFVSSLWNRLSQAKVTAALPADSMWTCSRDELYIPVLERSTHLLASTGEIACAHGEARGKSKDAELHK